MQEPKYRFEDGRVINRATGAAIPLDEPVMVFRAADIHALPMLKFYLSLVNDASQIASVEMRIADFDKFAIEQDERMKEPDTQLSFSGI